jgi:hypothetical protein
MRKVIGSRYDINLSITDIAKAVREYAKTNDILKECKFSITISRASMCQELNVTLMSAPKQVFVDKTRKSMQGAHYHKEPLTTYGQLVIETITEYVQSYNYDDSDPYTDYFSVNFYESINIGKWDRPFEVVAPKQKVKIHSEAKDVELAMMDYSDKSFVVIGTKTKEMKDVLKMLGGRFSNRLSCGCGWVFSKNKQEAVKLMLNLNL